MKYSLLAALASYCLTLAACPAKAQTKPLAVTTLRPRVVRLDSGTVALRPLIGFTRDAYDELQYNQANDEALLLVRAQRIAVLRQQRRTDSLAAVTKDKEIRRLREERAHAYALVSRAELETEKALSLPLKPPLLLDGHTYKGALGGALTILIGFVLLRR